MLIKIERFSYSKDETEGVMILPNGKRLATIEQPWVPNPKGYPGGKTFESCIPDGMYHLRPHESRSKGQVYIIINEDLGVYGLQRPKNFARDQGRRVCYIHAANWAFQLEGCIAPGLVRLPMRHKSRDQFEPAVTSSGSAMGMLKAMLGREKQHILSITSVTGASDVNAR